MSGYGFGMRVPTNHITQLMGPVERFVTTVGHEVTDPDEEVFFLFTNAKLSQDLGMVDTRSSTVQLEVAGRDLTIHQSLGLLSSERELGTTGAAIWRTSILFAEWISQSSLFKNGIFNSNTTILELGCGTSGILGLVVAPRIHQYIATDQEYVLKTLQKNLDDNTKPEVQGNWKKAKKSPKKTIQTLLRHETNNYVKKVRFLPLDWECHSLRDLPQRLGQVSADGTFLGFDAVLACDCIYNDAITEPFVRTCVDLCEFRSGRSEVEPTLLIIAQQLRSSDVFELWLTLMVRHFRVWRVSDEFIIQELRVDRGYSIHFAILRSYT